MSMTIGVVMDPIAKIKPWKDSTLAMLLEARRRDWRIAYMTPADLYLRDGRVFGLSTELEVRDNHSDWFSLGETTEHPLAELDMLLMRQDPPFNAEFLYTTHLLETAEREGLLVVNRPGSVRDCNEKLFAAEFPQCCAPTLVSRRADLLRAFVHEHHDTVMKPLDGMGGTNVFRVEQGSDNLSVIIEVLTRHGQTPIMAQRYIPEISTGGDKRILMINGTPVPHALARVPGQGELRGNLAAGGRGEGRDLTDRDRWICEQVGPTLKEKGLYFVGLDVIGDYLTEINVTSPTCVREIDAQFGLDIGTLLMEAIERRLAERGA